MRRRLVVLLAGVGASVVLGIGAQASRDAKPLSAEAVGELGPLVSTLEARATVPALVGGGIELVPAIQPPTSVDGRVRIIVALELPRGAELRVVHEGGARHVTVPNGSLASRIEAIASDATQLAFTEQWVVLDVRATAFEEAGEQFRLLRPSRGALKGIAWPRTDEGSRQASAAIEQLFERGIFGADARGSTKGERERRDAAAHLIQLNDCASCHGHERVEDRRPSALVQRGTDAGGLYQIAATLSDEGPFERYRPRHPSREDPFVHVRCAGRDVRATTEICSDGLRPVGWLDVRAAIAAQDPHARRVCASRRALFQRMDADAQRAFRDAVDVCGAETGSVVR